MADKAYASITVNFGDFDEDGEPTDASRSISLELDDDKNDSKTQFDFGETAWVRVFCVPSDMTLNDATSTDGTVEGPMAGGSMTVEDEAITFNNSNIARPSKPVSSITSKTWLGTSLGALSAQDDGSVKASQTGTAVAVITYTSEYKSLSITLGEKEEPNPYPVIVSVSEA